MPEVLEPTTQTRPKPKPFFTKANASEYAKKGNAIRWASPARLRIAKITEPATSLPIASPDERLELLQEQIDRTRVTLNGKLEPQHRAALLRALCDLLDQQRIARGEPLPGSRKPAPERRQFNDAPLQPRPACGPDTTTGSVKQQVPDPQTPQGN